MRALAAGVGILAILAGTVFVAFSVTSYNLDRKHLCEQVGMEMVRSHFSGSYGCASIVPFETVEQESDSR